MSALLSKADIIIENDRGPLWAMNRRSQPYPADIARPRLGSRTVNSVKSPTALSTVMVPPCYCAMIS
jgi:hypothetical protein